MRNAHQQSNLTMIIVYIINSIMNVPRPEDNRTAGQVLHWMQSLLSSTDPILVFVNCSVIFLLLTCSIRLVACLLPKCNK